MKSVSLLHKLRWNQIIDHKTQWNIRLIQFKSSVYKILKHAKSSDNGNCNKSRLFSYKCEFLWSSLELVNYSEINSNYPLGVWLLSLSSSEQTATLISPSLSACQQIIIIQHPPHHWDLKSSQRVEKGKGEGQISKSLFKYLIYISVNVELFG